MAEMPPPFSTTFDGILSHNPMGDVLPKKIMLLKWLRDPNIVIILVYYSNWHGIVFWIGKATVNRNSLPQIVYGSCIHKARCATGYFGVLSQSAWDH